MNRTVIPIAFALVAAVGCQPPPPKVVQLSTNPPGATLSVNGTAIGAASRTHPFDFGGDTKA